MRNWLIILNLIVIFFCSTSFAGDDWQLYDDFSSGSIDTGKWTVDDSSATISIDNGRAKFVHSGTSGEADSSWLEFKNPAMIAGIKATMTIEDCDGDARARIGGFLGKDGENTIWTALGIRADKTYLSSELAILDQSYEYVGDYNWGRFKADQTIGGSTFTISIIFSKEQGTYQVENEGTLIFDFPAPLSALAEHFKGIGTRSNDGNGTCTVYFDDVYVIKKTANNPAVNFLLLN